MKISPVLHLFFVALCWNHATCHAQTTGDDEEPSIRLVNPTTSEWEMGLRLSVAGGEATGIVATCPLPVEWPEQSIKLLTKNISDNVSRVTFKELDEAVQQMIIVVPRLQAGQTAEAIVRIEISKSWIEAPNQTASLTRPRKIPSTQRTYLTVSYKHLTLTTSLIV